MATTWGAFKAWMEQRGVQDEDLIWYIDWSFDPEDVERDPDLGWKVS